MKNYTTLRTEKQTDHVHWSGDFPVDVLPAAPKTFDLWDTDSFSMAPSPFVSVYTGS